MIEPEALLVGWDEISTYLGVTTTTCREWAKDEELLVKRYKKRVVITKSEADKFLGEKKGLLPQVVIKEDTSKFVDFMILTGFDAFFDIDYITGKPQLKAGLKAGVDIKMADLVKLIQLKVDLEKVKKPGMGSPVWDIFKEDDKDKGEGN